MFEKCLFCRGAALLSLLAEQFPKKALFCRGEASGASHAGPFLGPSCEEFTSGRGLFWKAARFGIREGKSAYFSEARPYPACWRSEFPKNAYFAEARPLEPMQSAAAAARGRPQVPKSAAGSGENAPEARFGEAARDFQPKMPS